MRVLKALVLALVPLSFVFVGLTGCSDDPEKMLKSLSDKICACDNSECAMTALRGPENQKLKKLDPKKVPMTDTMQAQKRRQIDCIMKLAAKDAK
ncbi:MAG: hypothetical protein ACI9U2_002824 [Bradymonadia bacterium]|jgi:hypothetical protein